MNTTLVVIDMQDRFLHEGVAEYAKCLKETAKQIGLAKRRGDHIIFVEFDENSEAKNPSKGGSSRWPTSSLLKRLTKNYAKAHYVFKKAQDGGDEVTDLLRDKKIPRSNVRVCGVYAGYCVKATVETLAKNMRRTKISLVKSAIACYGGDVDNKSEALTKLTFFNNVSVMG